MTARDLRDLFTGFGEIKEVQIIRGRGGAGFVTFATPEQGELAKNPYREGNSKERPSI